MLKPNQEETVVASLTSVIHFQLELFKKGLLHMHVHYHHSV